MVCTFFLAWVNLFVSAWMSIKLGEWVRKDSFPLRDWTDSGKRRCVWCLRASSRAVVYPSLFNTLFSSLTWVPVVCCFAHVLNSSAYLRWCALDLFWVFLLPTCLLLPLLPTSFVCLVSGVLFFFCPLCKALHFLCNFFWRYFHFIQPASFMSLKNRNSQPAPPPTPWPLPISLCHPIHSSSPKPSVCVICCFSLLLVLGRFKEWNLGQVVKGSSTFFF